MAGEAYGKAVATWQMERHRHVIRPDWVLTHHGVLPSLFQLIRAFLPAGSGIALMTPAFPPFLDAITLNGHRVVPSPLVRAGETYVIDFGAFEDALP